MNKIINYINSIIGTRKSREQECIDFSNSIIDIIGINPPDSFKYGFGKWKIVKTNRCYSSGWITLLEVIPSQFSDYVGFCNTNNPDYVEVDGTKTINLMPLYMRDEFIEDLKKHLN